MSRGSQRAYVLSRPDIIGRELLVSILLYLLVIIDFHRGKSGID